MLNARLATEKDKILMFEWVNDPLTRKNSFNSEPISLSAHCAWLAERLKKSDRCKIFIVENEDHIPVGQVRLEENLSGEWEIDYSISNHFRGKKLGKRMLFSAILEFRKFRPDSVIIGKVKQDNIPSRVIFESIGFDLLEQNDTMGIAIFKSSSNL